MLKAKYDKQLAMAKLQQEVFISQSVTLAEMHFIDADPDEHPYFEYGCRCGGLFLLENRALDAESSVIVQCDTCSLHLQVSCL